MADHAAQVVESVSIGRVLNRGIAVLTANPVSTFGISFVFGALPSVVFSWFQLALRQDEMDRFQTLGLVTLTVFGSVISVVFQSLVTGALVRSTIAYTQGRETSFAESARAGLAVAIPLVALSLLLAIGVGIGWVLLLVPGIILYCMWAVAAPALVEERPGIFAAFGRSRALTKGARWKVFGIEAIMLILVYLFTGLFFAVFGMAGFDDIVSGATTGHFPVWWFVWNAVASTITIAVWSVVQTSLYVELRAWKEGPSGAALAEVFA